MAEIPLRLGAIEAEKYRVCRGSITWLRSDGYMCQPGEIIAYCNIDFSPSVAGLAHPLAGEMRDFQVALAPEIGGRLRIKASARGGGALDQLASIFWNADEVIGYIDVPTDPAKDSPPFDDQVRLMMVAGRRMTEIAEVRSGFLTGWHERSRAWWGGDGGEIGTMIGAGICELSGVFKGTGVPYADFFQAVAGPAHIVFIQDEPLVPSVQVLKDQLLRTPEQMQAITDDVARTLLQGAAAPNSADWLFVGALLAALQRNILTDRYTILTRSGLRDTGMADALVLSLAGESRNTFRHRRLGYILNIYGFRLAELSKVLRGWFVQNFEQIQRTVDDVHRDFAAFMETLDSQSNPAVLILNSIETLANEDISSYVGFEKPLSKSIATARAKEMNLMLHDLARTHDVSIVDVDAIASDMGVRRHTLDAVHHSGALQTEIRDEILHILDARGVPGFRRRAVR